jgi:hypothetical protein
LLLNKTRDAHKGDIGIRYKPFEFRAGAVKGRLCAGTFGAANPNFLDTQTDEDRHLWEFGSRNVETTEDGHRRAKMVAEKIADRMGEALIVKEQCAKVFLIVPTND